jgi:hypothetical protein
MTCLAAASCQQAGRYNAMAAILCDFSKTPAASGGSVAGSHLGNAKSAVGMSKPERQFAPERGGYSMAARTPLEKASLGPESLGIASPSQLDLVGPISRPHLGSSARANHLDPKTDMSATDEVFPRSQLTDACGAVRAGQHSAFANPVQCRDRSIRQLELASTRAATSDKMDDCSGLKPPSGKYET